MAKNTNSSPAYWRPLPLLVGAAGALVTLFVWSAVQQRETAVREQLLQARLAGAREIVKAHVESSVNALQRMTRRWELRDRPVHSEWLSDATLYVTHYADYRALLWLDANRAVQWRVERTPKGIVSDRRGANLHWVEPMLAACRAAPGPLCTSGGESAQNHVLFLLPVSKKNKITAYVAGVFDIQQLFSATLHPGVLPAYGIAILDRDQPIYQRIAAEPAAGSYREIALDLPGLDWRLRLWPAPGELTHAPSLLSILILSAGLLMSGLLAVAIRLAQNAARRSRDLERAITACTTVQTTLRESEARYRAVVEDQTELICRFAPDGMLTFVNPAYGRYFSASLPELVGKNWLEFLPPDEREGVRRRFQSLTPDNPVVTYQHRALLPSGEARWQEWTDHAVFDDRGAVVEYQSVGRDITGRRREEELRLKQAARQRDALVREVHHRIKNHLQGVIGLLRQQAHAHPELADTLTGALTQVQSIATVHGLHSRAPHRHPRLDELVRAVARTVEDTGPAPAALALALCNCPAMELTDAEAVPVALIVNELICNAVKHAGDGEPPVKITLDCQEASARLRISNPCPALPPGFDFANSRGLGTGLGLVQSLLPSKGATLKFTHAAGWIEAELCLQPPAIVSPAPPEPGNPNHEPEKNTDRG